MKYCFLMCKSMYDLKVYSILYTLRKNTFSLGKRTVRENALFFLLQASIIKVYFLIHDFYMNYELKHNAWLSKNVFFVVDVVFFFFDSASFYQSLLFCSKKSNESFTLKRHSSIKNETKATRALPHDLWVSSCSKKF